MHSHGLSVIEQWVTRPRPSFKTLQAHPLTPVIGAEIEGIDLARPLSEEQADEIRRAFLEYKVIVLRDQNLTPEDHKRFGRIFGELHVHALKSMQGGDDARLEVAASKASKYVAGEDWHADVTADAEPPKLSMLYIDTIPEIGVGGDTLFANMGLAYRMLSPALQSFLEGLTAIHDGAIPWTQAYGYKPDQAFARNEHPVVIRHPETGEKILYVNRGFTSHIVQLNPSESQAMLEMLYRTIERCPALTCRVRWTANTVVVWDNFATQHHAIWDYYPLNRHGYRVSVIGERPVA